MRETARDRSSRLLLEGRLIISEVTTDRVRSIVRGEGHLWSQTYDAGAWSCDCPVRSDQCSHLHAVRRVVAVDIGGQP